MEKKNKEFILKKLKLRAVKMYLEDGLGSTRIAKELNLSSYKRVMLWVKNYNELGEAGLEERRGSTKSSERGRTRTKVESMEKELERLRAENA
ncbi:helix-turn-helix domain-containing protein [Clostridium perfringens]|nr:helix-turn-helix domain-containing protein [Clostridium perfringens]